MPGPRLRRVAKILLIVAAIFATPFVIIGIVARAQGERR